MSQRDSHRVRRACVSKEPYEREGESPTCENVLDVALRSRRAPHRSRLRALRAAFSPIPLHSCGALPRCHKARGDRAPVLALLLGLPRHACPPSVPSLELFNASLSSSLALHTISHIARVRVERGSAHPRPVPGPAPRQIRYSNRGPHPLTPSVRFIRSLVLLPHSLSLSRSLVPRPSSSLPFSLLHSPHTRCRNATNV